MDSKPYFRKLFRPLAKRLAAAGVSANQVTSATIVVSVTTGAVVLLNPDMNWPLLLIPCALTLRLVFNHVDGLLAVEYGTKSDLGAILNEVADFISDIALYAPIAGVSGINSALVLMVLFFGLVSETVGLAALRISTMRREDGPMSKKARGLVFSAVAVALGVGAEPGVWLDVFLVTTLLLIAATIVRRTRSALAQAVKPC